MGYTAQTVQTQPLQTIQYQGMAIVVSLATTTPPQPLTTTQYQEIMATVFPASPPPQPSQTISLQTTAIMVSVDTMPIATFSSITIMFGIMAQEITTTALLVQMTSHLTLNS